MYSTLSIQRRVNNSLLRELMFYVWAGSTLQVLLSFPQRDVFAAEQRNCVGNSENLYLMKKF